MQNERERDKIKPFITDNLESFSDNYSEEEDFFKKIELFTMTL